MAKRWPAADAQVRNELARHWKENFFHCILKSSVIRGVYVRLIGIVRNAGQLGVRTPYANRRFTDIEQRAPLTFIGGTFSIASCQSSPACSNQSDGGSGAGSNNIQLVKQYG